jgi:ribosomal protein L11 methyltransferase
MGTFLEVVFTYDAATDGEILLALLAEVGFDSFKEEEGVLTAYIEKEKFDSDILNTLPQISAGTVSFEVGELQDINWNEEWEKHYDPVNIEGRCYLRAGFHAPDAEFEYELLIEPKMSFGTGHHDTTYLMIKHMLDRDFTSKTVFDIGTGTGVLAVFAAMKGAEYVLAIDNSPWSAENTLENAERNGVVEQIEVREAEITEVDLRKFDFLLANINRNVILSDLDKYKKFMHSDSRLLLSGIMIHDAEIIKEKASKLHLHLVGEDIRGSWCFFEYSKSSTA